MSLRRSIQTILFDLASQPILSRLASWGITHMDFLLPARRILETTHWIVLEHPRPAYPFHLLIISRHDLKGFMELPPTSSDITSDLTALVQRLVKERNLSSVGYRLIVNGGPYQNIPHLHFHLVSGQVITSPDRAA